MTSDLLSIVREVRSILNGKILTGKSAKYYSSMFRTARYATVLKVSSSQEIFQEDAVLFNGVAGFTLYGLKKTANILSLDFDRSKASIKVYRELEKKGEVKIITKQNKRYFVLTDKGSEKWKKKMEELKSLRQYLEEEKQARSIIAENKQEMIHQLKNDEPLHKSAGIQKLIAGVAEWD